MKVWSCRLKHIWVSY